MNSTSGSGGAAKPTTAHVGATIDLKDQSGHAETVTVVKVVNPATGSDQFSQPQAGKTFIAVQLSIKNNSTAAIAPNPDLEVTLIDSNNQSYNPDFGNTIAGCQAFASTLSIAPADTTTGCVAFQVPSGTIPAKTQYTPSSGFSGSTGQWLIP